MRSLQLAVLILVSMVLDAYGQDTSISNEGSRTYHLVVEQTNLFTRYRSWARGQNPPVLWQKCKGPSPVVEPWPPKKYQAQTPLLWENPKAPKSLNRLSEDKRARLRPFFASPQLELPPDFPGLEELLDFITNLDAPGETLRPGHLEVQVTQSPYRREFLLTLSGWESKPQTELKAVTGTFYALLEDGPEPRHPTTIDDLMLSVGTVSLGMAAEDYLALESRPPGVSFRADNDTVVFVTGDELSWKPTGQSVRRGEPVQGAADLLIPLGFELDVRPGRLVFTNDRVRVDVIENDTAIERFVMLGNLPEGGEVVIDSFDSVLTIHGLRPGASEKELLEAAGPAEQEDVVNGYRVLRWGIWPHEPDEVPGVRLEAVLRGGRIERLRGDRIEQKGRVLCSWRTPLPPGWDPSRMIGGMDREWLQEFLQKFKYYRVTGQTADLDRAPRDRGPERVLEFTDRGLSIWEYPGERRQFQLVIAEPPTLGVDLSYP